MVKNKSNRCSSCGTLFIEHLGIIGTCAHLQSVLCELCDIKQSLIVSDYENALLRQEVLACRLTLKRLGKYTDVNLLN